MSPLQTSSGNDFWATLDPSLEMIGLDSANAGLMEDIPQTSRYPNPTNLSKQQQNGCYYPGDPTQQFTKRHLLYWDANLKHLAPVPSHLLFRPCSPPLNASTDRPLSSNGWFPPAAKNNNNTKAQNPTSKPAPQKKQKRTNNPKQQQQQQQGPSESQLEQWAQRTAYNKRRSAAKGKVRNQKRKDELRSREEEALAEASKFREMREKLEYRR